MSFSVGWLPSGMLEAKCPKRCNEGILVKTIVITRMPPMCPTRKFGTRLGAIMSERKKRIRRKPGDFVAIPLGTGSYGFARVLPELLLAFYDRTSESLLDPSALRSVPVAFTVWVMNHPITDGTWPVLGYEPLPDALLIEPRFFKKDPISGSYSIYRDSTGEQTAATREQCERLERAAVWEPKHIVDRLNDHFSGRPNKWVQSLRP
jgi:hypothetical protein